MLFHIESVQVLFSQAPNNYYSKDIKFNQIQLDPVVEGMREDLITIFRIQFNDNHFFMIFIFLGETIRTIELSVHKLEMLISACKVQQKLENLNVLMLTEGENKMKVEGWVGM
jgi:hypothetical protein